MEHIVRGLGDNVLSGPEAVAIDQSGNLHVAGDGSKCIKVRVFTADGEYVRQYGSGQLQSPAGVIQWIKMATVWSEMGLENVCPPLIHMETCSFCSYQLATGSLRGVARDKEGFVYVVDYGSSCVYKF